MKTKTFTTKTGDTGVSYHLENGDEFKVVDYDKVGVTSREVMLPDPKRAGIKRKTEISSYFIKVLDVKTDQTVTLTLTKTQAERLIEKEPLKEKVFTAYEYKNKHDESKPNVGIQLKKK